MTIDAQRLWNHIQELGTIGQHEDGSITRLPFTKEDKKAEELITRYMKEAGLQVHIDETGNIIGTLLGTDNGSNPILCGSHIDSVKHGGKFDGCLGVLAGIEVLHAFIGERKPIHTIHVIAFKDEEGNRFGYGMVGSKSISGTFQKEGLQSTDEEGITLKEAMEQFHLKPLSYRNCELHNIHLFIEVHIEQAKLLEKANSPLGIVDGIAGLVRYEVTFQGESGHAGATPMEDRCDPVTAMSKWICKITELAKQKTDCVATIGKIVTFPGACNVICDHVVCSLDLRSIYEENIESIIEEMKSYQQDLYQLTGIKVSLQKEQTLPVCLCDDMLKGKLKMICKRRNISYRTLMSGAGHDAMNFKDKCPISMLFVRSKGGYSHRKEEYSSIEDCALATEVLYDFIKETAYEL